MFGYNVIGFHHFGKQAHFDARKGWGVSMAKSNNKTKKNTYTLPNLGFLQFPGPNLLFSDFFFFPIPCLLKTNSLLNHVFQVNLQQKNEQLNCILM